MNPSDVRATRPVGLLVVAAVELLEAAGLLVLAVLAVASGPSSRYPQTAYGVGGTLLLAAALLVLVGIGTLRARPWSRTSGLVWQVVQLLVGLYAFQGQGAQPGLALIAIVPAVAVIVLLFTRPVREATARSAGTL
ncbi:MAG: hypothetical protein HIU86_14200 [Acidobacteria bacterium]|nr:hypothetical protein [Acidobacteriota bacterium]